MELKGYVIRMELTAEILRYMCYNISKKIISLIKKRLFILRFQTREQSVPGERNTKKAVMNF